MDYYNNNNNYYILKIFLDPVILSSETIQKYTEKISDLQKKFINYKIGAWDVELGHHVNMDAGFDLFVPNDLSVTSNSISNKINHGINCSMTFNNISCAYYLYPRSSMGGKTPLRLSNSVGIIDSGYRGHITGIVDNIGNNNYDISENDRLLQICGPNIMYPVCPLIVNNIEELGFTERGSKGFGSTGR